MARRPARAALLAVAVAVASAGLFASAAMLGGLGASMQRGFSRLGADLLIIPRATLANVKAALLVVEPTEETLDPAVRDRVAALPGVALAAPQRVFPGGDPHAAHMGHGGHMGGTKAADVIAFDPALDFTVQPWIEERLPRPLRDGDVIVGAQSATGPGGKIDVLGHTATVYARLGRTAVGTHEQGLFLSFATARQWKPGAADRISGVLVQLAPGASPEAVRFALAGDPSLKVVSGASIVTSVRQSLVALIASLAVLAALMLLVTALMVGVVYSAVVAERRRELGLLLATGAGGGQVARMIAVEAAMATGFGGILGVLLGLALLRVGQRTVLYSLAQVGVPFAWPSPAVVAGLAVGCVALGSLVGLLGALYPAWRTMRADPYDLIRAEG
jgi:putative ABC transport system permease protein